MICHSKSDEHDLNLFQIYWFPWEFIQRPELFRQVLVHRNLCDHQNDSLASANMQMLLKWTFVLLANCALQVLQMHIPPWLEMVCHTWRSPRPDSPWCSVASVGANADWRAPVTLLILQTAVVDEAGSCPVLVLQVCLCCCGIKEPQAR